MGHKQVCQSTNGHHNQTDEEEQAQCVADEGLPIRIVRLSCSTLLN
jgi:hypothetical protein